MKTTLLIPVLNEIDGLKAIMPQIKREWVDQILFVDGQSTDGTVDWIKQNGYEYVIQQKKGMRYAYLEAWPHIKGDVVLTFSPDGNSVSDRIPPCIEKMKEGYDMVIVSRYAPGAKSDDDDAITGFGNWMFTSLINLCHGGHYTDAMVIYRAYRKDLIYELGLDLDKHYEVEEKLFHTRVSWEPLLSMRAARKKLRIAEIPGDEPARLGGVRKLQIIRWGSVFMYELIREMFIKNYK
ncbi:MAG: glycosyltransferase family 2 protein [Candidatus Omnitrophica bacterium]|nr:glycosyltransferase family 2 protein [Candidatus Omnitrophota bacterium]